MRLSYVILVATAALFACCGATSDDQTKLSTMTAEDMVGVGKRQLRSVETTEEDEERLALGKLKQMVTDEAYRIEKFEKWNGNGVTFDSLKNKLDLSDTDMVKLRNLYNKYLFG